MSNLATPASIVIAGLLISVAILIVGRWEIVAGGWKLDRWSGEIRVCTVDQFRNVKCQ